VSNGLKYAGIALAGGVVGAALGLLYAPTSGEEARRRLAHKVEQEKEALRRRAQQVQQQVSESRRRLAAVVNG
jgi:gas vesicle protein